MLEGYTEYTDTFFVKWNYLKHPFIVLTTWVQMEEDERTLKCLWGNGKI